MPQSLTIELLENGLDSAHYALERLAAGSSKRDLKHAVLFLSSAVELVLKERLRRHDWRLIFSKVERANEGDYARGDFNSVGLESAIERLEGPCGVEFPDGATGVLRAFKWKRNKIEHFGIVDTVEAITASAAATLGVLLDFIAEELAPESLGSDDAEVLEEIRVRTAEFSAFVGHRMHDIADDLDGAYGLTTCPCCLQDALVLGDVDPRCRFCGYRAEGEEAARRFVSHVLGQSEYAAVKDGGTSPRRRCPNCWAEALVIDDRSSGGMEPSSQEGVCLSCGESWGEGDLEECPGCGELFSPQSDGMVQCSDCFNSYVSRDNT